MTIQQRLILRFGFMAMLLGLLNYSNMAFAGSSSKPRASCTFNNKTIADGQIITAYIYDTAPYGKVCKARYRTCRDGYLAGRGDFATCAVQPAASCTLDNKTIAHGQSIEVYTSKTVPYGKTCIKSVRTCTNGNLPGRGDFFSCSVEGPASCTLEDKTVAHGQSIPAFAMKTVPYGDTCQKSQRTCTNGLLSGSGDYASCTVASSATGESYKAMKLDNSSIQFVAMSDDASTMMVSVTGNLTAYAGSFWQTQYGLNGSSLGPQRWDVPGVLVTPYATGTTYNRGASWSLPYSNPCYNTNCLTSYSYLGSYFALSADGRTVVSPGNNADYTQVGFNISNDGGRSSHFQALPAQPAAVVISANGTRMFALGAYGSGVGYVSFNSGNNWTTSKISPLSTNGYTSRFMSIPSMSDNGNVLVAITSVNTLIKSIDGGLNWTVVSTGFQTMSSAIQGLANSPMYATAMDADGSRLAVLDSTGAIRLSKDAGATWEKITLPSTATITKISMSSNGQVIAAAPANGYAYLSTDGGVTWVVQSNLGRHIWSTINVSRNAHFVAFGAAAAQANGSEALYLAEIGVASPTPAQPVQPPAPPPPVTPPAPAPAPVEEPQYFYFQDSGGWG